MKRIAHVLCLGTIVAGIGSLWLAILKIGTNTYQIYALRVDTLGLSIVPKLLVSYIFGIAITVAILTLAIACRRRSIPLRAIAGCCLPLLLLSSVLCRSFFLEGVVVALLLGAAIFMLLQAARWPESIECLRSTVTHDERQKGLSWWLIVLSSLCVYALSLSFQLEQFELLRFSRADTDAFYLSIRNTALGRSFMAQSPSLPLFYDHFDPAKIFLLPVYWLLPHVSMMFFVQSASLSLIGIAAFMYARHVLRQNLAAVLCGAMVLLHPSTSQMAYNFSYGYQLNSTAFPLLIFSAYLWERKRLCLFATIALLTCLLKETNATFYIAMGMAETIARAGTNEPVRPAFALLLASGGYLLVVLELVLPAFAYHDREHSLSLFSKFGGSTSEIAWYFLTNPIAILEHILSRRVLFYLALVLGAFVFFPVFDWRRLSYGVLSLFGTIFMSYDDMLRICFWHQVDFLAAACLALPHGLAAITQKLRIRWPDVSTLRLGIASLCVTILMASFYGLLPFSKNTLPWTMQSGRSEEFRQGARRVHELAENLPENTKILTTDRVSLLFLNFDHALYIGQLTADSNHEFDVIILDYLDVGWTHSAESIAEIAKRYRSSSAYHISRYDSIVIIISRAFIKSGAFNSPS